MVTPGSPFPEGITEDDIEKAEVLARLLGTRTGPGKRFPGTFSWSRDGCHLAWSSGDSSVTILPWREYRDSMLKNANPCNEEVSIKTINTGEPVSSVAFGGPAGSRRQEVELGADWFRYKVVRDLVLATGHVRGLIRIWNMFQGEILHKLLDHTDAVVDLKFSTDGSMRLLSASLDGTAKLWDMLDDGNMCKSFSLGKNSKHVHGVAWRPDSRTICVVGDSNEVSLFDGRRPYNLVQRLKGHHHHVTSCAFSPDGVLLATGSSDATAIVWDIHTGDVVIKLGHLYPMPSPIFAGGQNGACIKGVAFRGDGRHLVTTSEDRFVRFWDLCDSAAPCRIAPVQDAAFCSYSPDNGIVAVGDGGGSLTLISPPLEVATLQHLCRVYIRLHMRNGKFETLCLPRIITQFLQCPDMIQS